MRTFSLGPFEASRSRRPVSLRLDRGTDDRNTLAFGGPNETVRSVASIVVLGRSVLEEIDRTVPFVLPVIPRGAAAPCAGDAFEVRRNDEHIGVASLVVLTASDAAEQQRARNANVGLVENCTKVIDDRLVGEGGDYESVSGRDRDNSSRTG